MNNITQNIVRNKIRHDLEIIASLVDYGKKILDIGCGDGELLEFLTKTKNVDARGLEISTNEIEKAISKGLSVIQADAENDLTFYPDQSFDYAILSQTIQATHNPKKILQEMLRIAKFAKFVVLNLCILVVDPEFADYIFLLKQISLMSLFFSETSNQQLLQ